MITDATGTPYYTQYAYDKLGNLLAMYTGQAALLILKADGTVQSGTADAVVRYTYDTGGRVTSETDALGAVESYEYDKNGFLIKKNLRGGGTETYNYASTGALLNYYATATGSASVYESYTYYQNGLLRSATNDTGTYLYTYYGDGNLAQEIQPMYNEGAAKKTYEYDSYGNLYTLKYDLASTGTEYRNEYAVRYQYSGGNLMAVYDNRYGSTPAATYEYDNQGRMSYGNGVAFLYNSDGQVISEWTGTPNAATYTYDSNGPDKDKDQRLRHHHHKLDIHL